MSFYSGDGYRFKGIYQNVLTFCRLSLLLTLNNIQPNISGIMHCVYLELLTGIFLLLIVLNQVCITIKDVGAGVRNVVSSL